MFTGLVQKTGSLAEIVKRAGGASIAVTHEDWDTPVTVGESIAVHGVCLTVARGEPGKFQCDILEETVRRTNLGSKARGAVLNLERALLPTDRIGGHFVLGHVDGTGRVDRITEAGADYALEIACGDDILRTLAPKGSIACDGISLTIAALLPQSFEVHIVPVTWRQTAVAALKPGDTVNLETDIIGKYVWRRLSAAGGRKEIDLDDLRNAGFPV